MKILSRFFLLFFVGPIIAKKYNKEKSTIHKQEHFIKTKTFYYLCIVFFHAFMTLLLFL